MTGLFRYIDARDRIERIWRESGYHTAADHLKRCLDGAGGALIIDRDEARSFRPLRDAEQKNDHRFEGSFLRPDALEGHADKLKNLKEGECRNR